MQTYSEAFQAFKGLRQYDIRYIQYQIWNMRARMRFHFSSCLVVLRICAPQREHSSWTKRREAVSVKWFGCHTLKRGVALVHVSCRTVQIW